MSARSADARAPLVLLAGATGQLGRELVPAFRARGWRVRALVRRAPRGAAAWDETHVGDLTAPATLRGAADGAALVFSCAGASMRLGGLGDRAGFAEVDERGNRALLDEALRAGVPRMGYVAVAGAERLRHTAYVQAHEAVVAALREAPISTAVVRATGFYSTFVEFLAFARRGIVPVIGDGSARTNPIHERDLAEACVESALAADDVDREVGGPEVLTRDGIARLAFAALGRAPRLVHAGPAAPRLVARALAPVNPRLAALLEFGTEVSLRDVVAPAVGVRELGAFFRSAR